MKRKTEGELSRQAKKILQDAFYTRRRVVKRCVSFLKKTCRKHGIVLENAIDFSGGDGKFAKFLGVKCVSYDIEPRSKRVQKRDWFDVQPDKESVSLIGFNPPFGYQSVLLKRFLEHAAKFNPELIAVIHPVMKKNLFPKGYEVIASKNLRKKAFFNPETKKKIGIPNCRFSILHRSTKKVSGKRTTFDWGNFSCVLQDDPWGSFHSGFAIRRKGVQCGKQVIFFEDGKKKILVKGGEVREFEEEKISSRSFHKMNYSGTLNREDALKFFELCCEVDTHKIGITPAFNLEMLNAVVKKFNK